MGPATGLLALAVLEKDQQPSAHDRLSIINRRPQLLKPQYSYEPTQGPCGALNLSMKTAPPSERLDQIKSNQIYMPAQNIKEKHCSWKNIRLTHTKKSTTYRLWMLAGLNGRETALTWALKNNHKHNNDGCLPAELDVAVPSPQRMWSNLFGITLNITGIFGLKC